jgi:hypothetical protein
MHLEDLIELHARFHPREYLYRNEPYFGSARIIDPARI